MTSHTDPAKQQLHQVKNVTAGDYPYFNDKLEARKAVLRSSILRALPQSRFEQPIGGQVHDAKDDAFANLLSEVDAALVSQEVAELRDIESAQQRLDQGVYGRCVACRADIEWRRLDAYPAAPCCLACQDRREHR